ARLAGVHGRRRLRRLAGIGRGRPLAGLRRIAGRRRSRGRRGGVARLRRVGRWRRGLRRVRGLRRGRGRRRIGGRIRRAGRGAGRGGRDDGRRRAFLALALLGFLELARLRDARLQRIEVAVEDSLVIGVLRRAQEVDEVPTERVVVADRHVALVLAVVLHVRP